MPKPADRIQALRDPNALRKTSSLPDRLNETQFARKPLPPYITRNPPPTVRATASSEDEVEQPQMSRTAAVMLLLVSTGLVALCAEFLVDAIPAMTSQSSVSQAFIGLIILPIVGNAAEHVTAVTVATKNKMDLAIGVAVGSSIQIALFVTPLVVILGWMLNKSMSLYFNLFETISLFVTAFVVNFLVLDGKSNYLEGTLLIAAYVIIAVAAFFYPDSASQSPLGGSEFGNATTASVQMAKMMLKI
jgi:Ca2+:H+ antiporter